MQQNGGKNYFSKSLSIVIPERVEWNELLNNSVVWFNDSSKNENGVGVGAWEKGGTQEIVCSLDQHATVFQAEIRAITEAANWLLERNTGQRTVNSISVSSREVLKCRQALEALATRNMVRLLWVPGHSGVVGNKKADRLAGRGADGTRAKRCAVAVPACEINKAIKGWLGLQLSDKWTNVRGLRQAKALMGDSPPEEWLKTIIGLSRNRLRLAVGWLTGHWSVGYHLWNLGLRDSGGCRWCEFEMETTSHLLCECPAFTGTRHRVWGVPMMGLEELRQNSLASICQIAEAINKVL